MRRYRLTDFLRFVPLLAVGTACLGFAAQPVPPALDVELIPHASAGVIDQMAVRMRIEAPNVAAEHTLLRMPTRIVSIPTAAYAADAIEAADASGPLALSVFDEPPTPTGTFRQYRVNRATVGDVTLRYATPPRAVDASTRNGPLFDMRQQGAGLMGAGVYFLALPYTQAPEADKAPYSVTLAWNLSQLPAGARGIWSYGEGRQSRVATTDNLAYSFYAAGPVQSEPAGGKGNFGLYWLLDPPFDVTELAASTRSLYAFMSRFFQDADANYRVFVRQNPYPAGGGTAMAQSFVFAYGSNGEASSSGDRQMLLAHEMAHNWPRLDGDSHSETAWYTEGTAEYYSTALSYRAGTIDLDKFLRVVNRRSADYAENPYRFMSNAASGEKFWSDARAQRVPYGRGFLYLVRLNAEIKAHSAGQRSVDTLVLEVLARQKRGEKFGNTQWRALVGRELGEVGEREFDDMVAGKDIAPHPQSFAPCLRPVAYKLHPFDLGFDEMNMHVVSALRKDSAAAAAGLEEGDKIIARPALNEVREDEQRTLALQVQRQGKTLDIGYLPRAGSVSAWRWEAVPGVAQGACGL